MNFIQNEHLEKLIHREENDIKNGNTIIQSRVGIFNYPIGFGRKPIYSKNHCQNGIVVICLNLKFWTNYTVRDKLCERT